MKTKLFTVVGALVLGACTHMAVNDSGKVEMGAESKLNRVWMLDEWPGFTREQLHQAKAEMNFTALPHVSAYMGCNRMMFEADVSQSSRTEGRLAFGAVASTRKLCFDGMALEQDFGNRIGSFTHYKLEGHRLILQNGQGQTARFVAQDWD